MRGLFSRGGGARSPPGACLLACFPRNARSRHGKAPLNRRDRIHGARGVIHVRKCAGVLEAKHLPLLLAAERPLFSWVSISLAVVVRRVASFRRNAVSSCRAARKLRHRAYRRALHHLGCTPVSRACVFDRDRNKRLARLEKQASCTATRLI